VSGHGVELSTGIASLAELAASDLRPYDAVYLGSPYCDRYAGNLLEHPGDLGAAVRWLHDLGKTAYLTTYAAPRSRHADPLRRALTAGAAAGVAAAEVHGPGLARLVRDEFPELERHVGGFANVYTAPAAAEYRQAFGVTRIAPPAELPLAEAAALAAASGVPVAVTLHGKVPLGVSETCVLLECEAAWGVGCPDLCRRDVFLERGDWVLKSVGTGVLTGRDVCLLAAVPRLVADGRRHFRIETLSESPGYRAAVGAVYRAALGRALAGDATIDPAWGRTLQAHSRAGFCNGFAFGRSGLEYVEAGADRGGTGR
jgi:U32 family peptidase